MISRIGILLLFTLLSVGGCASDASKKGPNYETIKANPKRDPEAAAKLNEHGVTALAKGKFEKSEKLFKDALIKDVDYGPAHNNLGRLYFDQGKNYLAAWEFEYATKVMPKRGEPYNNLGMVMERVGKMEHAIEAYETANLMCPNHPEIVGNLARVYWCHDKDNLRTRELMEQLVFVDCRPDWVAWAKEQIACGKLASNEVVTYQSPPQGTPMTEWNVTPPPPPPRYETMPQRYPAPPNTSPQYPAPQLAPPAPPPSL